MIFYKIYYVYTTRPPEKCRHFFGYILDTLKVDAFLPFTFVQASLTIQMF